MENKKTKWFTFRQNNSGGLFDIDKNLNVFVIIEAYDEVHALDRAIEVGIYFDGVERGKDCECCGNRWSRYCDESDVPSIYGETIEQSGEQDRTVLHPLS